jgi:hypothetical protein
MYRMSRHPLIDFIDRNRYVGADFLLNNEVTEEVLTSITNKNRLSMFMSMCGKFPPEQQHNIHEHIILKYKYNQSGFVNVVCSTSLMPGARVNFMSDIELFRLGFYEYHSINAGMYKMKAAAKEYNKDDYYTMMCKIEIFAEITKSKMNYYDINECPEFFLAVHYVQFLERYVVWMKQKHKKKHITTTKETLTRVREYLDNKKASYPTSCVGMNCIEKYHVLAMTIRRSTNNPPFMLKNRPFMSDMQKYLLKYCSRKVILLLGTDIAVAAKLGIWPNNRLFERYRDKQYQCFFTSIMECSNLKTVERYLHKIDKQCNFEYHKYFDLGILSHDYLYSITLTIYKKAINGDVELIRLIARFGIMRFILNHRTGHCFRKTIERVMRIHDIDMV